MELPSEATFAVAAPASSLSKTDSARVSVLLRKNTYVSTDINECLLDNHGCQFNCTNLPGTYRCECNYGYAKDSNGICQGS